MVEWDLVKKTTKYVSLFCHRCDLKSDQGNKNGFRHRKAITHYLKRERSDEHSHREKANTILETRLACWFTLQRPFCHTALLSHDHHRSEKHNGGYQEAKSGISCLHRLQRSYHGWLERQTEKRIITQTLYVEALADHRKGNPPTVCKSLLIHGNATSGRTSTH